MAKKTVTTTQNETIATEAAREDQAIVTMRESVETGAIKPQTTHIRIRGARQNNLKNISLDIPRDKLVVITGLSGSGKSSLAFDTLYAEGQRRYVESLSAYARQFLGQHDKPDVDQIEGLSPAVSIDQKGSSKNPRSTVGTVTEVYDYLRLLYARVGVPHDPKTGQPLMKQTIDEMVDRVLALPMGARFLILAPIVKGRKGEYKKEMEEILKEQILKEGYVRARVDGVLYALDEEMPTLERYKQHTIEIVVDRLIMKEDIRTRVTDGLEQALKRGKGIATISVQEGKDIPAQELHFNEKFATEDGGFNFEEIEPRLFSFNSPYGACPECHGLGTMSEFDPDLIIPDKTLSIGAGAIKYFVYKSGKEIMSDHRTAMFKAVCQKSGFTMETPIKDLSAEQYDKLINGIAGNVTVEFRNKWGRTRHFDTEYAGVVKIMERSLAETTSDYVREDLEQYRSARPCPACKGRRLKPEVYC